MGHSYLTRHCGISPLCRYHDITTEVLTSVRRTEDSLQKLKRSRRSLAVESSTGMSDDNKIRLQLALDIDRYLQQVTTPMCT